MGLREQILDDIKNAMKNKQAEKLSAIRMLQAAIKYREIELRPNAITDQDILGVVKKLTKQRKDSITEFEKAGRNDLVDKEKFELSVLETYMPAQMGAEQVAALKKDGRKIMKVFSVGDGFDFDSTRPYEDLADFFLFDTKGKYHGGNSRRFDWEILKKYNQRVPFFLSGGIGPADVPEVAALAKMNLHALDINSGVESAPALKDPSAVENVMRELKKINIDKTIAI